MVQCEKQWGITAKLGRLSSATASHGRLSSAVTRYLRLSSTRLRHCSLSNAVWWSDNSGLIDMAALVVMQAHGRAVCPNELEEMPAVAIYVSVVWVALCVNDAKENADDALADYGVSETLIGRPKHLLSVVQRVV